MYLELKMMLPFPVPHLIWGSIVPRAMIEEIPEAHLHVQLIIWELEFITLASHFPDIKNSVRIWVTIILFYFFPLTSLYKLSNDLNVSFSLDISSYTHVIITFSQEYRCLILVHQKLSNLQPRKGIVDACSIILESPAPYFVEWS